jgi:hypothetical protein
MSSETVSIESQNDTSPIPTEAKTAIVNNDLLNVQVTDENVALNVMVSFLNVAQKRGVFSFDESAKIWECIQKFIAKGNPDTPPTDETVAP